MSNFPLSHLPLSHQFSAVTWFQYLQVPPFLSTPSCMHPVSISKFRPPGASQLLPAFIFGSQKFPLPLPLSAFFACIFMYLHLVSVSRLHPSSLNNFLLSSCFNIELSLPPLCLSISCIHCASYVDFPHWPLHLLRFCCFNIRTSPASTTSCMHLVSISKLPPPCARSKKTCTSSKKEGAKVQKHPAQCERL